MNKRKWGQLFGAMVGEHNRRVLKRKRKKTPNHVSSSISRFAKELSERNEKAVEFAAKCRKYDVFLIKDCVALVRKYMASGMGKNDAERKVSALTGVPYATIHDWGKKSYLPKVGRYTKEKYMRVLFRARELWRGEVGTPRHCLRLAAREAGMADNSVKVHLCFQLIPALAGFNIYADPQVQLRAEQFARGEIESPSPLAR